MKKILLFIVTLIPAALLSASTVEVDGIYYNLFDNSKTAEVTRNPYNYFGSIIIPKTIEYGKEIYTVTSIGEHAFDGNGSLTSIIIPNSVVSIGDYAFWGCGIKGSVIIPNSVTCIGRNAFAVCRNLTEIAIPNSVTTIGKEAFWGCESLSSVFIPQSVTNIENALFAFCSNLGSIVVDSNNSIYDSRDNCNAIIETASKTLIATCKNTVIPNSVISIGRYAFHGSQQTQITIPNNITTIDDYAFLSSMSLTNVTIPNTVTTIGNFAFSMVVFRAL